ncbi:hypothetical protein MAPG_04314 [Magnaporthiopsis poae ATCC 64411]|uniref:Uncharacterized protein n=1 Tax=Magnaporthiopsis poae (strain ATCC 64411 / 73-15) TaxID=644358 RepID=A0A0C4DWD8_MAGP6|nr:hypothetical protein MAPG_04314 [Magnaporthiopsis poae ATCC 64411]
MASALASDPAGGDEHSGGGGGQQRPPRRWMGMGAVVGRGGARRKGRLGPEWPRGSSGHGCWRCARQPTRSKNAQVQLQAEILARGAANGTAEADASPQLIIDCVPVRRRGVLALMETNAESS